MYVRWNHSSYYTDDWNNRCRRAQVSPNAVFRAAKVVVLGNTLYRILTDKGLRLFTCSLDHLEIVNYGPKKKLEDFL